MTNTVNLDLIWASSGGVSDPGDVKYTTGWITEIPTFENFNFVLQNHSRNQLALAERPAHEWNTNISYTKGAIVVKGDKTYYCQLANQGQDPDTDATDSYWRFSQGWGEASTYSAKVGALNNVMFSRAGTTWLGQDQTILNNENAFMLFADLSARTNILFGMSDGELVLKKVGNVVEPNGSNIMPKSDTNPDGGALYVFHEGHPPIQEQVAGTIPEAPDDAFVYGRANNSWIAVGGVDGLKPFKTGTKMLFVEGSAPDGWTQDNTDRAKDRMLRVVVGVGDNPGGADDCIINNKVPVHRHDTKSDSRLDNHVHNVNLNSNTVSSGHKHNIVLDTGDNSSDHTHNPGSFKTDNTGTHTHVIGYHVRVQGPVSSGPGVGTVPSEATGNVLYASNEGRHYHTVVGTSDKQSSKHKHSINGKTDWQDANHFHQTVGDTKANETPHFHQGGVTDLNADKTYEWNHTGQPGGTEGSYIQSNTGDWKPRYLDIIICIAN